MYSKSRKQEESSKTHVFIGNSIAICFAVCSGKSQEVNSQKGGDLGAGEKPVGHTVAPPGPPCRVTPTCTSGIPVGAEREVCEQDGPVVCSRPDLRPCVWGLKGLRVEELGRLFSYSAALHLP